MSKYLNVPYLKTTNLAKVIDWFPAKSIVKLNAERRVMASKSKEKPLDYLKTWKMETTGFSLTYLKKRDGEIDKERIKALLDTLVDGIAVVTYLVQAIEPDDTIKDWLGPYWQQSKVNTGRGIVFTIWKPRLIGAGAGERQDAGFIEEIKRLNAEELRKKGFKLSTLDCVELKTFQQWHTHKPAGKNLHNYDTRHLSESIRKHVLADREWNSNRNYISKTEKGWELAAW